MTMDERPDSFVDEAIKRCPLDKMMFCFYGETKEQRDAVKGSFIAKNTNSPWLRQTCVWSVGSISGQSDYHENAWEEYTAAFDSACEEKARRLAEEWQLTA